MTTPTEALAALREPVASWIGRSGFIRPVGDPPDHDRAWQHMLREADDLLREVVAPALSSSGWSLVRTEGLADALEAEWYNGNMDEGAYDRLLVVAGLEAQRGLGL